MRGRKPDIDAASAKARSNKRGSRSERALEHGRALAERLASETADHDPLALPFFFDARYPLAAEVWRKFAPTLQRTNLLRAPHRLLFAGFCVFYAQWITATENLASRGEVVRVKTTNGSFRDRVSPWIDLQRNAWAEVMRLSQEFGLSPAAGYSLLRDQAALLGGKRTGDLFGEGAPADQAAEAAAPKAAAAAPARDASDMTAFDSPPPGLPN